MSEHNLYILNGKTEEWIARVRVSPAIARLPERLLVKDTLYTKEAHILGLAPAARARVTDPARSQALAGLAKYLTERRKAAQSDPFDGAHRLVLLPVGGGGDPSAGVPLAIHPPLPAAAPATAPAPASILPPPPFPPGAMPTTPPHAPTAASRSPPGPNAPSTPPLPGDDDAMPTTPELPPPDDDAMPTTPELPPPEDDAMPTTPELPPPDDDAMPTTPELPPPEDDAMPTSPELPPPPDAAPAPSAPSAPPSPAPAPAAAYEIEERFAAARHYNELKRNRDEQHESAIYHLRRLNNWLKAEVCGIRRRATRAARARG